MIPPANNVQIFTPNLAAQSYHGTHIISRNFHSIKSFHIEQIVFTRKVLHCTLPLVIQKSLMLHFKVNILFHDINVIMRVKRMHQAVKEYYNSDANTSMKPYMVHISKVYTVSIQID